MNVDVNVDVNKNMDNLNTLSSQLTLRQMIIFLVFLLVFGNLSILYSVYSPDLIITYMLILTIFCVISTLLLILFYYIDVLKLSLNIAYTLICILSYFLVAYIAPGKIGLTSSLLIIIFVILHYSNLYKYGIISIFIIHISYMTYLAITVGVSNIAIGYGYYIVQIGLAITSIYFTSTSIYLNTQYKAQYFNQVSKLNDSNQTLSMLNEALNKTQGDLSDKYRETYRLLEKHETLSLKYESLINSFNEGVIDYNITDNILTLSVVACELFSLDQDTDFSWRIIADNMTQESRQIFSIKWASLVENKSSNEIIYIKYLNREDKVIDLEADFCRYHAPREDKDYIVGTIKDVTDQTQKIDKIKHLAYHDFITNLPNRSYFIELVKEKLKNSTYSQFYMLCINLDKFKTFNSKHGYENGNRMLNHVGDSLVDTYTDCCFSRIYSNTFAMFIANKQVLEDDIKYIQDMLKQLAIMHFDEKDLTATIGAVMFSKETAAPVEALLLEAEKNIYLARDHKKESYLISNL